MKRAGSSKLANDASVEKPYGGQREKAHDPFLLPSNTQSGKSSPDARRDQFGLPADADRHQQGRTAHAGISRHQSERQGSGHRRYRRARRQGSAGVRFQRDPALSRREDGTPDRLTGRQAGIVVMAVFHRDRHRAVSGQAVHFQHAAPEKLGYAVNRYRREIERHYEVLDKHLKGRDFIVGKEFSIADISAWGWLDRAPRVLPGDGDPLAAFPNLQRWFRAIDSRPAVAKARAVGK